MAHVENAAALPPPKCFIRKARTSCRKPPPSEAACTSVWSETDDSAGRCENETIEPCQRPRITVNRAQYNRLVGEILLEEAQPCIENDSNMDLKRFEELFLHLSVN